MDFDPVLSKDSLYHGRQMHEGIEELWFPTADTVKIVTLHPYGSLRPNVLRSYPPLSTRNPVCKEIDLHFDHAFAKRHLF